MSALAAAVALPALVGAVLLLAGPRADRAAPVGAGAATAGALVALLLAGKPASGSVPFLLGQPFALGVDGLSLVLGVTVCVVTLCVLAAVPTQVERRQGRLAGFLLLFLAAVLLTLTATSLLPLLVGWELMGAASYVLIAHEWRARRAVGSATTALLTTRALDLGLYLAAGAALAGSGTLALAGLPALTGTPLHLAALGVTAAALGKAAQLPVSFWLSRAMDGPSPVSALLHSAAMVAMGGYLLLRTAPLLAASGWADDVAAWTGAVTAVVLGVVALAQTDLKQLLAASTASQLGFVVLAAGVGGTGAGAVQLVAHASVKSLLFLAAGIWLHQLGTRELAGLRGVALRTPAVGALAVAGLLALSGLPPFALWGSKDAVLAVTLEHSPALYGVALLASALSAAYAGRALSVVLRPARPGATERELVRPAGWVPLVPLAAGAVLLAGLVVGPAAGPFARLLGVPHTPVHAAGLATSGLLAAAVLAGTAWRGDAVAAALPETARRWLHLEAAAHAVAVRPVLALSGALAAFDDRMLDGAVERAARGSVRLAAASGRFDLRRVDGAVAAVAAGARRLGVLARRPQTGRLHQYYGQAAAVLVAATLLLLLR